jgi:hypothetical protein
MRWRRDTTDDAGTQRLGEIGKNEANHKTLRKEKLTLRPIRLWAIRRRPPCTLETGMRMSRLKGGYYGSTDLRIVAPRPS